MITQTNLYPRNKTRGSPEPTPQSCHGPHGSVGVPHVRVSVRRPKTKGFPQISYFALLARATCAALLKESRMKSISVTGLHRKSGGSPSTAFQNHPLRIRPCYFLPQ